MNTSSTCSIAECAKSVEAKGLCNAHYKRLNTHGDPLAGKPGPGDTQKFLERVVMTYEGEECFIWPFSRDSKGYGRIWRDGKMAIVSRVVCQEANGPPPKPEYHAAHSCGKGHEGCVARTHLTWKTAKDNYADRIVHGTTNRKRG